jgi:hypothetical protein
MKRNAKRPSSDADSVHPLETVLEHVAAESIDPLDDADAGVWARGVRTKVDAQLAALRRQLNPARPMPRRAARISDELLAIGREDLLARLEILRKIPEVQIAHLELSVSGLSTDDLRQLVAEIEATERTQA